MPLFATSLCYWCLTGSGLNLVFLTLFLVTNHSSHLSIYSSSLAKIVMVVFDLSEVKGLS